MNINHLLCPHCGFSHGSEVLDSRSYATRIRRRRRCGGCKTPFTTYETVRVEKADAPDVPLPIVLTAETVSRLRAYAIAVILETGGWQ